MTKKQIIRELASNLRVARMADEHADERLDSRLAAAQSYYAWEAYWAKIDRFAALLNS